MAARVSISSSRSTPQAVIGLGNSRLAVDVAVAPERFISIRPGQTVTESNLVKVVRRGDGLAFGELGEWSRERLLRVATRILGNNADAEDAVQDSLLNAFVKLRMFDGRSTFLTWVTRITINCSLMRLRTRRKYCERYRDTETGNEYEEANCPDPNPEQIVAREEEKKLLYAAVDALPNRIKVAVKVGSASTAAYSSFFSSSRATICSGFGSGQFASSYSLPVSVSRYLSQYFLRVRSLIRLQLIVIRVTQVRNVDLPSNILSLTKAFSRESWTASSASALFPRILVATLSRRSLDHSASSPNARPSPLLTTLTRFDSVTVCPGRMLMNRSGATATSTARRLFPSPMTACGVERELDIETRAAMAAALPARNSVALRFPG